MSDTKRIIIQHESAFNCIYHVKARLKTKENIKKEGSLLGLLREKIEAAVQITYNDDCSVDIKIGEAWTDDWDEIDERVMWLLIERVNWLYDDVEIVLQTLDGTESVRTVLMSTHLAETAHEEFAKVVEDL